MCITKKLIIFIFCGWYVFIYEQDFKDSNNNLFPGQSLDKAALDHRILDAIHRRAAAKLHLGEDKPAGDTSCLTIGQAAESGCLTIGQSGEAGCLTIGPAGEPGCLTIGQSGESSCLSLGLLNSFTSSSSVTGTGKIYWQKRLKLGRVKVLLWNKNVT